jgi:hypothetical protein
MTDERQEGNEFPTSRRVEDVPSSPGIVSIWVGELVDEGVLDDYVAFRYTSNGDGWSPFTHDHGLTFIDEDFAEAAWWEHGEYSFAGHSYGESFASSADVDLAHRFPGATSAYLVYDIDARTLPASEISPLTFLNAYTYKK